MFITANAVIRNYVTLIALKYKYELINYKNFKKFYFILNILDYFSVSNRVLID
jgi:hypothetical protein